MRVLSERPSVRFSELFEGVTSRSEVVVTFLALLELIRLKQITAVQREPFGEIEICRVAAGPERCPRRPPVRSRTRRRRIPLRFRLAWN